MQRLFGIAQDISGRAIPSASITVKLAGSATSATLYSDNSYTPLANPFTSDSDGTYEFFARNGRYDITLIKTGYTFDATSTTNVLLDDRASVITPAQIVANTNDYAPTNGVNASIWRISTDAARNITGIAGGQDGQQIILVNAGVFTITLVHNSGLSTLGNRFFSGTGADVTFASSSVVTILYDGPSTLWRIIGKFGT